MYKQQLSRINVSTTKNANPIDLGENKYIHGLHERKRYVYKQIYYKIIVNLKQTKKRSSPS